MATENNADGFNEAAGKDALLALLNPEDPDFNADIVPYARSEGEKREKQDEIIAKINEAMENHTFTQIAIIDKDAADKLTESSKAIITEVENSTAFLSDFGKFAQALKTLDFEGVKEMSLEIAEGVQRRMELASLSAPVRWLKSAVRAVTGQRGGEPTLKDLRVKSRQNLLKFAEAIADLEEANDQIPVIDQSLDAQENARLELYSDYGLVLGAVIEARRQWREEKIPALQQQARESRSPQDLRNLRAKERGLAFIDSKALNMDVLHKKSLVDLDTIDDLKDALTSTQFNIMNHLTSSQAQWYASAAKQQATAAISKMTETVHEVDELSDEIATDDQKLSDIIFTMAETSLEHGTNDVDTVLEMMQNTTENTITRAQNAVERAERIQQKHAALAAAKEAMVEAKMRVIDIALQDAESAEEEIKLIEHQPEEAVDIDAELNELAPVQRPQPPAQG